MKKVMFGNADVRFSSFVGADLSEAIIYESNFENTILLGANLNNADINTSSFTKAQYNSSEITANDFWMFVGKEKRNKITKAYCASIEKIVTAECIANADTFVFSEALPTIFSKNIDPRKLGMNNVSNLVEFARKFLKKEN